MESLRTYEHLALSDSLFQTAVSELRITLPPGSNSVLHINVLGQTRVLEVTATLPDPQQAQALAQYIAAAVVRMSGSPADAAANAGINSRTETLELVDPGVVPGRPSSPRLWFNLLAAFLTAFVLSLLYLSFEFGLQLRKAGTLRKSLRVASHG
jgi:capsular polysaccharide biosynthesis protein